MPDEVAALYFMMKNLHVLVEDPIRQFSQRRIWEIKASGEQFDKRIDFDRMGQLTWEMESELLRMGLDFYRSCRELTTLERRKMVQLRINRIY